MLSKQYFSQLLSWQVIIDFYMSLSLTLFYCLSFIICYLGICEKIVILDNGLIKV